MTILKKLYILLFAALAVTGCNDEKESGNFEGKDNRIVSFALTKDGVTYDATIVKGRITVTVPYNVSLRDASLSFEMCENASLQPDPATITDWDQDRQFLVTSYNLTDQIYVYTVEHADIVSPGNVTFNTQREVDDFAATGISALGGNLTIGGRPGEDPILNLDSLKNLVSVRNNLLVTAAYRGKNLFTDGVRKLGLANLKEVRGNITVAAENTSLLVFSLPALAEVTGNITLNSTVLQAVELPSLARTGGAVEVWSDALNSFSADVLEQVDGDLTLAGSTAQNAASPCDFFYLPGLHTVSGTLRLAYFGSLANTKVIFPELIHAGGVAFENLPLANEFSFPEAESFGDISIDKCPVLTKLSLPKLGSAGSLSIRNSTLIRDMEFPVLERFTGNVLLNGLTSVTGLNAAFPTLTHIEGDLFLDGMSAFSGTVDLSKYTFGPASVVTLQGKTLAGLKVVSGPDDFAAGLFINGLGMQPSPTKLPFEFSGFKRLRALHFANFGSLSELSLPVETCDDMTIELCGGSSATGFSLTLPALTEVRGTLLCKSLGRMDTPSAVRFPRLRSVGRQLAMYVNAHYLTEISLPVLETVGDGLPVAADASSDYALYLAPAACTEVFMLPKLRKVDGNILFSTWTQVTTRVPGIGCPALETVTGNLEIGNKGTGINITSATRSLDFQKLTQVRSVFIGGLSSLADFSTFAQVVPLLSEDTWTVSNCTYNPTYPDMREGRYTAQ